jgi:UDP:flavonoid glycosyltransferase YjiC (YdhE family)
MEQQKAVVYVAFGTMHSFTEESVNALYDQLRLVTRGAAGDEPPSGVSVLWSLPATQQSLLRASADDHVANSIRLETFVPQWEVLAAAQTVVFVSHCGANSVNESLLNGVPLVCCPGKADQPANAARVASSNTGVLSKRGVYSIHASLQEVLDALPEFTHNARKMRDIFECQGGAATGAAFVHRIITCGAGHLTLPYKTCGRYSWAGWCGVVLAAAAAVTAVVVLH